MKQIPSYPFWLSAFILLGPFLIVTGAFTNDQRVVWVCQLLGAAMIVIALFYLSKRLHEQTEEVASLRQQLDSREK
jgi:hypothetical protein